MSAAPQSPPSPGHSSHLGGSPVDPAFAVGVDVHQHQSLHQVREDKLRREGRRGDGVQGSPLSSHLEKGLSNSGTVPEVIGKVTGSAKALSRL